MATTTKKQSKTARLSTKKKSASSAPEETDTQAKKSNGATASSLFGFALAPRLLQAHIGKSSSEKAWQGIAAHVHLFGSAAGVATCRAAAAKLGVPEWQLLRLEKGEVTSVSRANENGPVVFVWIGSSEKAAEKTTSPMSGVERSAYARARDTAGPAYLQAIAQKCTTLNIELHGCGKEEASGALVALEVALYDFVAIQKGKQDRGIRLVLTGVTRDVVERSAYAGFATNMARHLANLPASILNPVSFAEAMVQAFSKSASCKVDVISGRRLAAERMNLLAAVGQGSPTPPCLVHIRYRPKSVRGAKRPIAIVGKGITFDTGGVDIKDAGGMRLMKKDMGGSAAVAAFAFWAHLTSSPKPFDAYLALAENSVDGQSFRPGDVIESRARMTVEIHNTDAEGRLVLADAMNYALSQEGDDAPTSLIDLATLTGAIKVALGTDVAGLFSNSDKLTESVLASAVASGERCWRMPLVQEYRAMLSSNFADMSNASSTGFGGAITAALFLESFAKKTPWAHLDIYSWTDKAYGPYAQAGATGQGVQLLIEQMS